jgi:hypothetical protein
MMFSLRKLLGVMIVLFILVSGSACSAPAAPSPTPVPATATAKPTKTRPAPTATRTPKPTATDVAQATQIVPPAVEITATVGVSTTAATAPAVAQPTSDAAAHGDKYEYVSQNLADNYQVKPGTPMTIVWTVKNVGTVAWGTDYMLRFFTGPTPEKQVYNFPKTVKPGESAQLSVPIVAPADPGTYNFWWKLTNNQNQNFGDVNFVFIVTNTPGAGPTNTPSP